MNKRKRVGGDLFSPSLSSLSSLLCFESLFSRVLGPQAFFPCTVPSLTDNSGSRVPSNGSNQLASRVPRRRWSREKDLRRAKRSPLRRAPACSSLQMRQGVCRRCHLRRRRRRRLPLRLPFLHRLPILSPLGVHPLLVERNLVFCKGVRPRMKQS